MTQHHLNDLIAWGANLLLGLGGLCVHEYLVVVGTLAVTLSAVNGFIMLWRTLRKHPGHSHDAT